LRQHLQDWARARGLAASTDAAGNLLLRKAATAGCETAPTLALQGHLDMVCQAKSGVAFDFLQSPISPHIDGDWLRAENTTLGADNGIGVALALAALEDPTLRHGPLEVLLTVDEEAGMGGAHGLQPGWLKARYMLNLDTEEWGEFYLGCAGGCDVNVSAELASESTPTSPPAAMRTWTLSLAGLRGGHSGCDIHLRRGNANRLLAEALLALDRALVGTTRLATLDGGNARNALPREASATLCFAASDEGPARSCLDNLLGQWRTALGGADGDGELTLRLDAAPASAVRVLEKAAQQALLSALTSCPYGVAAQSRDFPGVVETSNNLGIVRLAGGSFSANLMVRSLRDADTRRLAEKIAGAFTTAGCRVDIDGHYPGWTPNPSSPLLALCQRVYHQTFGADSTVQVIHAGLECGIIGAKYPGLDIVSFGPTIRGAHAPGEAVEIASVGRCWTLLRALIEELAQMRAQTA
jgi:dipeptidase D